MTAEEALALQGGEDRAEGHPQAFALQLLPVHQEEGDAVTAAFGVGHLGHLEVHQALGGVEQDALGPLEAALLNGAVQGGEEGTLPHGLEQVLGGPGPVGLEGPGGLLAPAVEHQGRLGQALFDVAARLQVERGLHVHQAHPEGSVFIIQQLLCRSEEAHLPLQLFPGGQVPPDHGAQGAPPVGVPVANRDPHHCSFPPFSQTFSQNFPCRGTDGRQKNFMYLYYTGIYLPRVLDFE